MRPNPVSLSRVHALDRRLSPETRATLVADYASGISANQLAQQYQLSRSSIRRVLRESGVARRYQTMNKAEVERAVQLYASGRTIADVADQLGRPSTTVQTALSRHGVVARQRHDYP
jgi:transposase-like protein